MKNFIIVITFLVLTNPGTAQTIEKKLAQAVAQFETDPQLRHAILSVCVTDAATGKQVYAHHAQIGLAPASTQKILTSVAAFDLLGNNFRFATYIGHDTDIKNGELPGDLFIIGKGDPTFGSWRWKSTTDTAILHQLITILQQRGIRKIKGNIWLDDFQFTHQPVPEGWIWQDMGNYYGAGCWSMNWRENQYDLVLASGACCGDLTSIVKTVPELPGLSLTNFIRVDKKGSGDNGYIFTAPYSTVGFTTGTIPAEEKKFTISGSLPYPSKVFARELEQKLGNSGVQFSNKINLYSQFVAEHTPVRRATMILDSIQSPTLDSINYWFLRRSINLYGEALVKMIAYKKTGLGNTDVGVELVKDFWGARGIDKGAINIMDGSGLSPQNRVTTDALVKVLQYARTRPWYASFYKAMPEYNGMKMKSGSVGGARAFTGYHTAKNGKQYTYAIIVNNYDGSSGEVVKKMYKVLDVLK